MCALDIVAVEALCCVLAKHGCCTIYIYKLVVFHFEDTLISRSAPLHCSLHCSHCVVLLFPAKCGIAVLRGELSYLAPLGSEDISAPYFKQCFFQGAWGITPQPVKHHASQSQDRNNKYFILYIEFCINDKI